MKKTLIIIIAVMSLAASALPLFAASKEVKKVKEEGDLRKPSVYEDVRGSISNGIYANTSFGFTINLKQEGFSHELSNQEGYKHNFKNPEARADDNVLSVYTQDFSYTMRLYQSSIQGHEKKTAEGILADYLSQYRPQITQKNLGGMKAAFAQVKDSGRHTDYYAMVINSYFIKWEIRFGNSSPKYADRLNAIVNSIKFDWEKNDKN